MKRLAVLLMWLAFAVPLSAQVRVEIVPLSKPNAQKIAAILRGAILGSSSFIVARDSTKPRLLVSIATSGDSVLCGAHAAWAYVLVFDRAPNPAMGHDVVSVGLYYGEDHSIVTELLNDLDKAATLLGLQ